MGPAVPPAAALSAAAGAALLLGYLRYRNCRPAAQKTHSSWSADGFDHVAIGVSDLRISCQWYKCVLGMQDFMAHEPTFVGDDLAFLRQGAAYLALMHLGSQPPLRGSRVQKGHFALRVDGPTFWRLHTQLPSLLRANNRPAQSTDVFCDDFAVQISMFFFDPDGNEVEITTWDVERDDSCSRFGGVDSDRSIRGNGNTEAAVASS
jgi:catechol 2,3-dioxygenase-like lactoylglutathione lyase family enzyme